MNSLLLHFKAVFFLSILLFNGGGILFSQTKEQNFAKPASWTVKPFERKAFIENKGQFENYLPEDKKAFIYCIDKGYQLLFYKNELCYRFTKITPSKGTILNIFDSEEKKELREKTRINEVQYITVKWLNANPDAAILVEDEQSTSYSYTVKTNQDTPNTLMCKGYSKLTYKNLYPNIDVEYTFHPTEGIKYNLILHPGADITAVKMQYIGAKKTSVQQNNIHIKSIVGDIVDHAPVTFYTTSKEKIESHFTLLNNIVTFNLSAPANQEITIDPWTVVPGFASSKAYDNGTDNAGNIYVYGGSMGSYAVEKYPSTGGAAIWSLSATGIDRSYYGDMLVDGSGNFYLSEGFVANGAHTYKYGPSSAQIWRSTSDGNFREHWRLALNCVTNKVIVAGGGTTSPTLNIAEIDVTTGSLVNAKSVYNQSQSDVAGLCVDEYGKAYLKHSNPNIITFTDNANNFIANINDGYNLSEIGIGGTPTYYSNYEANGYNFMALGDTAFLFTTDGATIKKYDANTHTQLASAVIPGGQQNKGSGILADKCNNVFVGASNGVYRFDFNLVQKEYKSTTAAVFDIAYSSTADIIASGDGFITPLPFGREPCGGSDSVIIVSNPCNPEINTVTILHTNDNPPYFLSWDDGSTDSVRTNLTVGDHIVTVKSGLCNPAIVVDTVRISSNTQALSIQQVNPLCNLSNDGDIKVTLLKGQQITGVTWTPSVTNSLLNDSTSHAQNLLSGTYQCHISSDFGCSFDTTITLTAPPLLQDSLKFWNARCPADANGSAVTFAYGGTPPYTYSWDTNPVQTTSAITNIPTGTYHVVILDSNSCKKFDSLVISSNPLPTVGYTAPSVCYGDSTVFTNASNIVSGTFTSVWHFGNTTDSATTTNANYFYPACASYTSTLTVTSDSGCVSTLTKPVTVFCTPSAAFTASDTVGCEPVCTNFQNAPLVPTGVGVQWAWTLGDGNTATSQSFDHCYNNDSIFVPEYYTIALTVTTDSGCTTTLTKNNYITVYPNPIASFSVDPASTLITNPTITITNLSVGATFVNWNFGDTSATSTVYTPAPHSYADTGTYTIQLITSTQYGCIDSTYKKITIDPDFAFYIPNAFSPDGDGINDTFNGTGIFIKEYQMRIFDRWGNFIFQTTDIEKPWNGKANDGSSTAQQDVYIYVVKVTDIKNKEHSYRGTVTLVR